MKPVTTDVKCPDPQETTRADSIIVQNCWHAFIDEFKNDIFYTAPRSLVTFFYKWLKYKGFLLAEDDVHLIMFYDTYKKSAADLSPREMCEMLYKYLRRVKVVRNI